jgi:hypothetical protein
LSSAPARSCTFAENSSVGALERASGAIELAGRRGLAIWSASWQGGTVDLELKDGRWVATEISSWIT